jgi:hypothetical protein
MPIFIAGNGKSMRQQTGNSKQETVFREKDHQSLGDLHRFLLPVSCFFCSLFPVSCLLFAALYQTRQPPLAGIIG